MDLTPEHPSNPNPLIPGLSNLAGIGFSTGAYTSLRSDWPALLAVARSFNSTVFELSALSASELPSLVAFLYAHRESLPADFSVHAPSKDLGPTGLLAVAHDLLALSPLVPRIVIHPDAIGSSQDVLRLLASKIALENMDARKPLGQDVASLRSLFALYPQARFCFDVAHAYSVDPTLDVAHQLLDAFSDRLVQVHVSGITKDGHHCPLTTTQLGAYQNVLARCHVVPWILESPLA